MKRLLLLCVGWLVFYVVLDGVLDAVDAPWWASVVPALVAVAGSMAYYRLLRPRRAREHLLKQVDPSAGPPPGATAVHVPLIEHLSALSNAKDYDALRSLLSDEFAIVAGRFILEAEDYIRSLKATDRYEPGTHTTDEVVVHPDEPDVVWVRLTASRKPRLGPAYVSTSWTRVTVSPDRRRVLSIAHAGVTQVA
ncbi:hypothetical protein C8N24_6266 [Solirubrobacter pauli]|uniref:DUF4440 domain-containing protein n=1 Tax=Solirubrobacter pauli TaxID=166793 RepID=A0A660L4V0_9ACTN|nr:hypothetical protein [Solirubrobacter pauli]RKQ88224.1 hypothetical protein C8N24_6266 [Solirubrobacter pauli]